MSHNGGGVRRNGTKSEGGGGLKSVTYYLSGPLAILIIVEK